MHLPRLSIHFFVVEGSRHPQDVRGLGRGEVAPDGQGGAAKERFEFFRVSRKLDRFVEHPVAVESAAAVDQEGESQREAVQCASRLVLGRVLKIDVGEYGPDHRAVFELSARRVLPGGHSEIDVLVPMRFGEPEHTIKQLVIEIIAKNSAVTNAEMIAAVKKEFPKSAFKETHAAWYRSQARKGLLTGTPILIPAMSRKQSTAVN